jgi:transposase
MNRRCKHSCNPQAPEPSTKAGQLQDGRREIKPAADAGLSAAEREELIRLRRENKQLRLERDILSRATAWFARETGVIPSGSSGS